MFNNYVYSFCISVVFWGVFSCFACSNRWSLWCTRNTVTTPCTPKRTRQCSGILCSEFRNFIPLLFTLGILPRHVGAQTHQQAGTTVFLCFICTGPDEFGWLIDITAVTTKMRDSFLSLYYPCCQRIHIVCTVDIAVPI